MDYGLGQKNKGTEALRAPRSICWIIPQSVGWERRWEEKLSIQGDARVNLRLFNQADGEHESTWGESAKGVAK